MLALLSLVTVSRVTSLYSQFAPCRTSWCIWLIRVLKYCHRKEVTGTTVRRVCESRGITVTYNLAIAARDSVSPDDRAGLADDDQLRLGELILSEQADPIRPHPQL